MLTNSIRTMSAAGPSLPQRVYPEYVSVSDIVSYFPVYRQGAVVRGTKNLDSESVQTVTKHLAGSAIKIAELEESVVVAHGGTDFKFSVNEEVKIRSDPNPIIDFPNFTFASNGLELAGRSCVTVCGNDRHSKIWVRIRLCPTQSAELRTFRSGEVAALFQRVEGLSRDLLTKTKDVYECALQSVGVQPPLLVVHEIFLKGVDFDDDAAAKFVSLIMRGRKLSEIVIDEGMLNLWHHFVEAFDLPQLALGETDGSEDFLKRLGDLEPWVINTSVNQKGFYLADINDARSMFWGFGRLAEETIADYYELGDAEKPRRGFGTADDVSIRLINRVGQQL